MCCLKESWDESSEAGMKSSTTFDSRLVLLRELGIRLNRWEADPGAGAIWASHKFNMASHFFCRNSLKGTQKDGPRREAPFACRWTKQSPPSYHNSGSFLAVSLASMTKCSNILCVVHDPSRSQYGSSRPIVVLW